MRAPVAHQGAGACVRVRRARARVLELGEHGLAAGEHVTIRRVEVAGVPGVGHVAGRIGPVEKAAHAAVGVPVKDTVQAPLVLGVHVNDVVPVAVLGARNLARAVAAGRDADLAQLVQGAVVRRVADLLARGGRGVDDKLVLSPGAARELLEHELRHRRAADIPMADKQDAGHAAPFTSNHAPSVPEPCHPRMPAARSVLAQGPQPLLQGSEGNVKFLSQIDG